MGFPGGSVVKNLPDNAGDTGLIPEEGNGDPLQYSCLGNSMDRGSWWVQSAWRIPWTEESGGLQTMGLERVRHDS